MLLDVDPESLNNLKAAATSISAEEFIHNLANKMEAK
jgi:hypothetical protein